MVTNHGIYRKQIIPTSEIELTWIQEQELQIERIGVFRCGIQQIFGLLGRSDLFQKNNSKRNNANQLYYHQKEVWKRLVFSMKKLNNLMQKLSTAYSSKKILMETTAISLEASFYAEHVLSYLNIIIDDIALLIVLIKDYKGNIDSMAGLKKEELKSTENYFKVQGILTQKFLEVRLF